VSEKLLIGSKNPRKIVELAELLEELPWEITGMTDFPEITEPDENGLTFEENATTKATYYAQRTGLCCVADDSGLVVDALDGAPGVHSARYAGPNSTDEDNNGKLLAELAGLPETERTARFVCCAALVRPGCPPHLETGHVEGRIGLVCQGRRGFGYDPLFLPDGYSQTFGEMPLPEKHMISHRGRALRRLRTYLASL